MRWKQCDFFIAFGIPIKRNSLIKVLLVALFLPEKLVLLRVSPAVKEQTQDAKANALTD